MTSNAKSSVAEQFVALEEGTTPSQLATSLSKLLPAGPSNSTGLEHLVWQALIHYVPIAYKISNGMHGERPAHCDTLLNCLGYLLFNGDPKQGLDELQANSTPQQMCGRVFRNGESTYLCLDCGVDMTCVLCTQCFHNSEHKKHRYRMAASGGSGCCDCGDEEAWKTAPHCSLHPVAGDGVKAQVNLDPELEIRATAVLGQCLRYCVQTLTWKDDTTPDWCGRDKYCILLYNDEVHTFDEIIKLLTHSTTLGVTADTAANLATIIDRDGRLPVASQSLEDCETMKRNLLAIKLQSGKPNVILKMFPHDLVLHQVFAISLLGWLENLSLTCGALQRILRNTMLSGSLFEMHSSSAAMCEASPLIIDQVLSVGNVLWKVSRCEFQSFVMSLMTSDTTQKVDFAIKFLGHYDLIQDQFLEDDHEHSMSMASLSVQFFTVPTVAYALLDQHDAFFKIMRYVLQSLDSAKDPSSGLLNLADSSTTLDMQRFFYVIEDSRYLLCHSPLEWTEDRRAWFMRGFVCMAKIFFDMEGMEPFKRKENDHVLYEKDWEEGFSLVLHFNNTVRRLLKWIRSDEALMQQCLQHIMDRICARPDNRRFLETIIKCRVDKPLNQSIVGGDIRKLTVSVHWPLRRFLARIITSAQNVDIVGLFRKAMEDYYPIERVPAPLHNFQAAIMAQCVLEQPLRTFIASQQVAGGMWRRNGHSLYGLMVHYDSVSYSMHDADLALFQVCACVLEPQVYIHTLLARLGAVFPSDLGQSLLQLPVEGLLLPNVETFFTVLLNIFGERYDNGVGCGVTDRMRVERELTHALFLGPLTHSEALKEGMSMPSLFCSDSGEKDHRMVDEVLKTLATRQNSRSQTAEYRLKEEYYASCTPFYYHYSKQQQSKAHMRGRQLKDWVGLPVLPALSEMLSPLLRLASSPMLILFLGNRLVCASNMQSKDWNEQTLHQMIYLIGLICMEEDLYLKEVGGRTKQQLTWSFMKPLFKTVVFPGSTLYTLLVKLQDNDRSKECRALLQHVIELLAAHKNRFLPSASESEAAKDETDGQALADMPSPKKDTADEERARRKKRAAEQRAKALERMQQLQKTFLATEMAGESTAERESSVGGDDTTATPSTDDAVAAGVGDGRVNAMKMTCILCQEEEEVTSGTAVMVMPGYSCISRVVGVDQIMDENSLKDFDAILCPSSLPLGVHLNSCGHAMHASCHAEWLATETQRRRQSLFSTFHCPMCNSVCNLAMPIFPRRTFAPPTCSSITVAKSLGSVATLFSLTLARQEPRTTEMMSSEDPPSPDHSAPPVRVGSAESGNTLSRMYRFIAERRRATRRSQSHSDTTGSAAGGVVDATDVLREFASKLCKRLSPGVVDNRLTDRVDIVGASLAYDIMCLERQLQSECRSVFGELSTRLNDPYDALATLVYEVRQAFDSMGLVSYSDLRLISAVVGLLPLDGVPHDRLVWIDTDVFHLEPFHLMVQLSVCLHDLAESLKGAHDAAECLTSAELQIWGLNQADYCCVALNVALVVQVVQILIVATPACILESVVPESEEELPQKCLLNLWQELQSRNLLKHWQRMEAIVNVTEQHLVAYVQEQLVPFLSRAALFLRFQGQPLPPASSMSESYDSLAKYLGLPETISEVLAEQLSADSALLSRWMNKVESSETTYGSSVDTRPAKVARTCSTSIFIPSVRGMCQLPPEYSDFIQRISTLECPQAVHDSTLNKLVKHPAMCMICGEFLCAMTYCCRKDPSCGNLSYHAKMCGGEVGVFLLVWDCKIMILAPPHGMLHSIPYLDEYGECASASGGRTINPLFLDETLFAELQSMWMRHGFLEKVWAASDRQGHHLLPGHWHDM